MKAFILLAALAVTALAISAPAKPEWPNAFSASVLAEDRMGVQTFFRWFYDYTNKRERFDGPSVWAGEVYWTELIVDHDAGTEYAVFYKNNEVTCVERPANHTMTKPDFEAFEYAGISLVNYEKCDHWVFNAQRRFFGQVWDRVDNREIVRIDVDFRGRVEIWTFMEMDKEPQDPSLFKLPEVIQGVCFKP